MVSRVDLHTIPKMPKNCRNRMGLGAVLIVNACEQTRGGEYKGMRLKRNSMANRPVR